MKIVSNLFDTEQGRFHYVVKATVISCVPVITLSWLIYLINPELEKPEFPEEFIVGFIGIVFVSPLIETLLMWPIIYLISLVSKSTWHISIASALLWAVLHSLATPIWGVIIFWSFLIFSISFVEWRKISVKDAYIVTLAIHMIQNLIAFGMYYVSN